MTTIPVPSDTDRLAEIQARLDACERGPHGAIGQTMEMFAWAGHDIEFLLAENEQLQGRLDTAEGQLDKARALHTPERRYVTPDDDESSYDDPEWIAEAWDMPLDQVHYFTVCSHCGSIELGTGGRDYRESLWPCKDAIALGQGGEATDE